MKNQAKQWTEDNVMVRPVDMDRLAAKANKEHGHPVKGYHWGTVGNVGFIETPKRGMLTDECVGSDVGDGPVTFQFYGVSEDSHDCIPSMEMNVTLGELAEFLNEPVTLRRFMGDRHNYNSRITGNLRQWLDHFNEGGK